MAPQAGLDAIELIRAAGIEVDFPAAQTCCGQPAYTSGYTEDVILAKGIEDKVFDFIAKPLSLQALLQKIREILDR